MTQASIVGAGWQSLNRVVRVGLLVQADVEMHYRTAARLALEGAAGSITRLVEGEQPADLLLLAGAGDWVEGSVRKFRDAGDPTPIVALNVSPENKANARILDVGADDCLACPFEPAELRARIHAVTRRGMNGVSRGLEIAADFDALRIRVRNVEARVSRRQFQIFVILAERRERWVHTDEIIAAVSGTHHDPSTSLVRVQIHALRKAIGSARHCIRSDGHKSYMLSVASE